MPPKEAEIQPWEELCVDLIGPYTIKRRHKEPLHLHALTMLDPATGWFEIAQYKNKRAMTIANIVEQVWFSRYPWPKTIRCDNGKEFVGHDFKETLLKEYNVKPKITTVKNPQANANVERIHQTLANMIRTFQLIQKDLDEHDPWAGILTAVS